jgi:hypothetical protein
VRRPLLFAGPGNPIARGSYLTARMCAATVAEKVFLARKRFAQEEEA